MNQSMEMHAVARGIARLALVPAMSAFATSAAAAGPGEALAAPQLIAPSTLGGTIAAAADGRFVVAWTEQTFDAVTGFSQPRAVLQRYAADASAVGDEVRVPAARFSRDVAMNSRGDFVYLYDELKAAGSSRVNSYIRHARSFAADGSVISDVVLDRDGSTLGVAIDDDGDYAVLSGATHDTPPISIYYVVNCCSVTATSLRAQRFSAKGIPLTLPTPVAASVGTYRLGADIEGASIASDGAGNFAVAWSEASSGGGSGTYSIHTRAFSPSGIAKGPEQVYGSAHRTIFPPIIRMSPKGEYTIAHLCSPGTSSICMRSFLAGGSAVSPEVVVPGTSNVETFDFALDAAGRPTIAASTRNSTNYADYGHGLKLTLAADGSTLAAAQPIDPAANPPGAQIAVDANGQAFVLYQASYFGLAPLYLHRFAAP